MDTFTSVIIWVCHFLCLKVIIYWFNFYNRYKAKFSIFLFVSTGNIYLSRNWSLSSKLSNLWTLTCLCYSLFIFLMSIRSTVITPPLAICIFSLFSMLFWLEICWYYWSFSKNQILVVLIFSIDFLFQILFTLDLIWLSFCNFLWLKSRLFQVFFLPNKCINSISFSLTTASLNLTNIDKIFFILI